MENQKFEGVDPRYSAVVPLQFLDKLLKCFYGTGPRDGENFVQPQQPALSPGVELQNPTEDIDLRDTFIKTTLPEGYSPRGAAKRKMARKENQKSKD